METRTRLESGLTVDYAQVEEIAKALYIRSLKLLPPDIKAGIEALEASERSDTARRVLGTMRRNIVLAELADNLLCQDTGLPIYNVTLGEGVQFDGMRLKAAMPCFDLRSSVIDRLLRCRFWKSALSRGPPGPSPFSRCGGVSILMTLAPQSASCRTQVGPERTRVRSRTVKRERAWEALGNDMRRLRDR